MKGADVAMASIVQYNDWLEEEVKAFINAVVSYWESQAFALFNNVFSFICQITKANVRK